MPVVAKATSEPTPITISGSVVDDYGNPVSGTGWAGARLKLFQAYRLPGGKTQWQLAAETACDVNGWGNGCPNRDGEFTFTNTSWGDLLWLGALYQIEVSAKSFGASRSETFYAREGVRQDFTLSRLNIGIWVDNSRVEIVGDRVVLLATTYGVEQDMSVLFDITAIGQSKTNDEEKALSLHPRQKVTAVNVTAGEEERWKLVRSFPELSSLVPGTRICFDVILRYDGYADWLAGRLFEPTCVSKGFERVR